MGGTNAYPNARPTPLREDTAKNTALATLLPCLPPPAPLQTHSALDPELLIDPDTVASQNAEANLWQLRHMTFKRLAERWVAAPDLSCLKHSTPQSLLPLEPAVAVA